MGEVRQAAAGLEVSYGVVTVEVEQAAAAAAPPV